MKHWFVIFCLAILSAHAVDDSDFKANAAAWQATHAGRPYVMLAGDSTMEGYNGWISYGLYWVRNENTGDQTFNEAYWLTLASGGVVASTNVAVSGTYWFDQTTGGGLWLPVPTMPPKYLYIRTGHNNVANGDTYEANIVNFNSVKASLAGIGTTMVVGSILPGGRAGIIPFNIGLSNWCRTNNVIWHDCYQLLNGTGANDGALAPQYRGTVGSPGDDYIHPNPLGIAISATNIYEFLAGLEDVPNYRAYGRTANVGGVRRP